MFLLVGDLIRLYSEHFLFPFYPVSRSDEIFISKSVILSLTGLFKINETKRILQIILEEDHAV